MKSTRFIFPLMLLVFLGSTTPSLALLGPDPTKVAERQENRQERQEARATAAEKRQTFLSEAKAKVFEKIYNRLKASLEHGLKVRLQQKTKVEARIAAREKAGKDMSAAKAKLAGFTTYQTAYNTDLAALQAKYQEIIASDTNPLSQMSQLRQAAQKVRQDLANMRQNLVDTIKLIIDKNDD